jgi:hypothetical protein
MNRQLRNLLNRRLIAPIIAYVLLPFVFKDLQNFYELEKGRRTIMVWVRYR